MLETDTIDLPAYWASYLINGDPSSLSDLDDEFDRARAVEQELSAKGWRVVGCGEDSFCRRYDGLLCDMLTYELIRHT